MKTFVLLCLLFTAYACKSSSMQNSSEIMATCTGNRNSINWPTILMYHDLVPTKVDATARDDLPVAWFDQELNLLEKQGYRTISMDELYEIKANPSKRDAYPDHTILLSFDDGYEGNYLYALPRLRKKNFKATFFVHTKYVGVASQTQGRRRDHMTWAQLNEIEQDPLFEVFSHTATHPDLTTLSPEKLKIELEDPLKELLAQLGPRKYGQARKKNANPSSSSSTEYIAYPFGAYNPDVVSASEKYYKLALAVAFRSQFQVNPLFSIPRMGVGMANVENEDFERKFSSWIPCL